MQACRRHTPNSHRMCNPTVSSHEDGAGKMRSTAGSGGIRKASLRGQVLSHMLMNRTVCSARGDGSTLILGRV